MVSGSDGISDDRESGVVEREAAADGKARWIFLDLDGTIADSVPGISFSLHVAFAAVGKLLPVKDVRGFIGPGIRTILKNLDGGLLESELDVMERCYRASYDHDGCLRSVLYPGVDETLRELAKRKLQLFVVTNKPKLATANVLDKFGLTGLFMEVVSRDSRTPVYGTKGEMLRELVEGHGVDPACARMIGDTAEDWTAAREAHLPFIYAAYGYGDVRAAEVERIGEFAQLLKMLGQVPQSPNQ